MFQKCKILLLLVALTLSCGCERLKEESENELDIEQTSEQYLEAFNKGDIDKLMSLWADDATYYNFTTQKSLQGKPEIIEFYQAMNANNHPQLKVEIQKITFPSLDTAIEKGTAFLSWFDKPEKKVAFQVQFVKKNDSWLLQKLSQIDLENPNLDKFQQIKDLNWFIGNWVDADKEDEMDIHSTFKWSENKSSLMQHFSMTILGQKELSGRQIITWDPAEGRIRSWIFDSDGGFGESYWSKENNSWYAITNYTLPNGKSASAVHIYTPIDENTYTFASINRDVDGNLLPNIGPFTVIRK